MKKLLLLSLSLLSLLFLGAQATLDLGTPENPHTPSNPNQDAFWEAVLLVDAEKAQQALNAGANPNEGRYFFAGNKDEYDTPLHYANRSKHPNRQALIDVLRKAGALTPDEQLLLQSAQTHQPADKADENIILP